MLLFACPSTRPASSCAQARRLARRPAGDEAQRAGAAACARAASHKQSKMRALEQGSGHTAGTPSPIPAQHPCRPHGAGAEGRGPRGERGSIVLFIPGTAALSSQRGLQTGLAPGRSMIRPRVSAAWAAWHSPAYARVPYIGAGRPGRSARVWFAGRRCALSPRFAAAVLTPLIPCPTFTYARYHERRREARR